MKIPNRHAGMAGPVVCGLWLSTMFTVVMLSAVLKPPRNFAAGAVAAETMGSAIALLVAVVWPGLYLVFSARRRSESRLRLSVGIAVGCFVLCCLCSIFFSPNPAMSAAYLVLTLAAGWVCYRFALDFHANPERMAAAFRLYAPLVTLQLALFSYVEFVPGYRLGEGRGLMEPATIGLNALSGVLASMAYRSNLIRLPLITALLAIIYLTQSRAPALAALFGLGTIFLSRFRHQSLSRKAAALLTLIMACGFSLAFSDVLWPLVERFLALNDEHRGLAAGGSGRLLIWQDVWRVILEHPFLGVGYRMHEGFLRIGTSAHNGYLALLAEIGFFGFIAAIFVIFGSLLRAVMSTRATAESVPTQSILLGFIASGLFVGIFERFLINTGNAFSVIFILAVLWFSLGRRRFA